VRRDHCGGTVLFPGIDRRDQAVDRPVLDPGAPDWQSQKAGDPDRSLCDARVDSLFFYSIEHPPERNGLDQNQ